MSGPHIVNVALGQRAYEVVIGAGVLAQAGARVAAMAKRAFIVTDAHVAALHLDALRDSLIAAGVEPASLVLPAGEEAKSFTMLEEVCAKMLAWRIERKDIVIAFGGGVIGDLAGFAAGIVKRGVDFVQIPTTLLAQVDSSVGGKTAIDTAHGKNLVGLFHQPRLVLADLGVLATLPEREMRAGYAEVVKYGLIGDPGFFDWCEAHGRAVIGGDVDALAHAVRVSVETKAKVVAADERESGARVLLNLGHTFAHALETSAGYDGALLHGEAVGAGMVLAFQLSAQLGLCSEADCARVSRHLEAVGLMHDLRKLPGGPYDSERLVELMGNDKKAEGGALTLVLTRGIGRAFVQKNAPAEAVRALLRAQLANAP